MDWFLNDSGLRHEKINGNFVLNPIKDGYFRGCSWMMGAKNVHLPKICLAYPTIMKLGTVLPYLKKIQKVYKLRDTLHDFC